MPTLTITLSCLILICAGCHIRAEYYGPRWQIYLCKPLTTSLIIVLAIVAVPVVDPVYRVLIIAGLLFCLAGDSFLMLPQDRFLPGLVSFLIGHLLYTAAFVSRSRFHASPSLGLLYAAFSGLMLYALWPHLANMRAPVIAYLTMITVMGWQAGEQWLQLSNSSARLAAVGAMLFIVSDSALALNRFHTHFFGAQFIVLSTYFAAQWLIALSVG